MSNTAASPIFRGNALDNVSFPIGGMGSGMFCLGGTGSISRFSLRHKPDLFNEPIAFSAVAIRDANGEVAGRVLEGPVPSWKMMFPWNRAYSSSGSGAGGFHSFGLPRFDSAEFQSRFPFGTVRLIEDALPLEVSLTGWSPFMPGDADATGLPVGAIEYMFHNRSDAALELVYSFHAQNFLIANTSQIGALTDTGRVLGMSGGFVLQQDRLPDRPAAEGSFAAWVDSPDVKVDLAWFRGGWFDALSTVWNHVSTAQVVSQPQPTEGTPSPGGSLYLPLRLAAGETRTVRLLLAWHVPFSTLRAGHPEEPNKPQLDPRTDFYRPWYSSVFPDISGVAAHWRKHVGELKNATVTFTDTFYGSTLPAEMVEAVAANLSILKSPTMLREFGGRLWNWEGCNDEEGSCHGSCTHVWNYAQALPHLFPALERGLRETEFNLSQDENGHQAFRSAIPLGPAPHQFHAAADGQFGGLIKAYREWRISGDTNWVRSLWPRLRAAMDYGITTWDPDNRGLPTEPHHNTYDVEFWGADGMCGSIYLAALQALISIGNALGEDVFEYETRLKTGRVLLQSNLYNGEYFIQKTEWAHMRADPLELAKIGVNGGGGYSTEAQQLLEKEGPKYQYGDGCLADGIIGAWMGWCAGLPEIAERAKVASHLRSVFKNNFRADLSKHANPQRPAYAFGKESGLLLCTWPKGDRAALPFPYSEEVWTGIEYQVASHLISMGAVDEGLTIVRGARSRYDGSRRNPFDEIECGRWYGRALASYALLQAMSGARYDAVERALYLEPKIEGDFSSFLSTATGFGLVGVCGGKPFVDVTHGNIAIEKIHFRPKASS